MSARKPRPVITVVDAKPMSETGFRHEQPKTVERPKPSPRDPNKSPPAQTSSPPSPGSAGLVQIMSDSKPGPKPVKPHRNYTVRYDPHSPNVTSNNGSQTRPQRSASPDNMTSSAARPVPPPRPRSMVSLQSEPMCLSSAQNDAKTNKQPALFHPEPVSRSTQSSTTTKPAILRPLAPKGPKGYHVVGSSIWYDSERSVPPQRPPPVKPKPVISPTSTEPTDKTTEDAQAASAKVPPDVVRRKPTIIRPTPLSSVVLMPISTAASALQQEATASTFGTAVASAAEMNGWNKPALHTPQPSSDMLDHTAVIDAGKPQAKQRPTIIKRTRPDTVSTTATQLHLVSADQIPSQAAATSQNSVEASRSSAVVQGSSQSPTAAVQDLQKSEDHGSSTVLPEKQDLEHHHDLKPVPRSQSQPVHSTEQELNQKIPPSKPPPPKLSNTAEEQKTTGESQTKDESAKERPLRPVSRPHQLPPRPSAPPVAHIGEAPELPQRPSQGHPLYHYMAQGPHALALFDYTASQSDELSFTAGDVITLESWVSAEWMNGSTGKACGMFPANFVEIVEPLPSRPTAQASSEDSHQPSTMALQMSGPRCVARFDYEATEAEDLGFVTGDVIRLKEHVGDEWLRGELHGKTGVFPVAFVEIVEHLLPQTPADNSSPSLVSGKMEHVDDNAHPFCIATYDFAGETADDLSFVAGDRITLLKHINDEWLMGSLNGREGMFPTAFVNIVHNLYDELPPRPKVKPATLPRQPHDASQPPLSPSSPSSPPVRNRPPSFTRETSHNDSKSTPGLQAIAVYDFEGDASLGDLVFKAGQTIVDVHSVADEWMSGRIGDRTGNFPTAFVQITPS